jgi:hypothetical protein
MSCLDTNSGAMMDESPRIKRILKILLPKTLPSAMSAWPAMDDLMLTASSGELVPKATTVSPIIRGEIPSPEAIFEAPRTKISAPTIRKTSPKIKKRMVIKADVVSLMDGIDVGSLYDFHINNIHDFISSVENIF